jgi:hypothetical protein
VESSFSCSKRRKNYCKRIHYTELAHLTCYLVVEIDLFLSNGRLFVLKTGDDERTDSNDVEAKNKRGLGTKEQVARRLVTNPPLGDSFFYPTAMY